MHTWNRQSCLEPFQCVQNKSEIELDMLVGFVKHVIFFFFSIFLFLYLLIILTCFFCGFPMLEGGRDEIDP